MSPQGSTDEPNTKRFDIYSTMLTAALVAIIIACLLLAMELGRYNWQTKPPSDLRAALPAATTVTSHLV